MKTFSLIIGIVTFLLLIFTLICGAWIHAKGLANDTEALAFHMRIGIASVISGSICSLLLIVRAFRG